jgi:hypothetical protein
MSRIQRHGKDGDHDQRIVVYPSRGKLALVSSGSLAFVVAGAYLVSAGSVVVGAVSIVFFGACGAYVVGRLVVDKPALVIDRQGIDDNASASGAGRIGWAEITEIVIHTSGRERFVGIGLHDPAGHLARLSPFKRLLARGNMWLGFPPVAIPQRALPLSAEQLVAEIEAFRLRETSG